MNYHLTNLEFLFGLELAAAFAGIPKGVTTLDLSCNKLALKIGDQLARAFARIPQSVTKLDLRENDLWRKTGTNLAIAFTGISQAVTNIDLSKNFLYTKTGAELAMDFTGIPPTVTKLNLSQNRLGEKTGAELARAFAGIPQGVTKLNLSLNNLYEKAGDELATAFASIPQTVTTLNLSWNYFYCSTGAELATAFAGIPQNVTNLNLSWNGFSEKTGAELATAFAGIPQNVTTLNLSGNRLHEKTEAELALVFAGIPQTVTTLDFGDDFSKITIEHINMILSLPKSITSIVVNGMHYEPAKYLLTQLFPLSARETYHEEECDIKPSFGIDEQMLVKIIAYLQNHPSTTSYLVCGMLLHGKINNTYNEDKVNLPQYMEHRAMAAIAFYRKAACDPELKPKIESILWHLRTIENERESIQNALKPYKLNPQISIPTYAAFEQDSEGLDCADDSSAPLPDVNWILKEISMPYAACRFFNAECGNSDLPSSVEHQSAVSL